jgi:hypothetical protein
MLPEVKEYRSNDYHFSVNYPADIPPQEFHERGHALTVAFQAKAGEAGVQIYVAPIIGTQITDERFLMDGPSGVRKDQTKTSVDGAQALTFHGFDAGGRNTKCGLSTVLSCTKSPHTKSSNPGSMKFCPPGDFYKFSAGANHESGRLMRRPDL